MLVAVVRFLFYAALCALIWYLSIYRMLDVEQAVFPGGGDPLGFIKGMALMLIIIGFYLRGVFARHEKQKKAQEDMQWEKTYEARLKKKIELEKKYRSGEAGLDISE